ncbi:MAG: AAA family ATPase [Cyanobacteria bacterium J06576_12]
MNQSSKRRGQVITFYSYKGGVGRSMALVNIGVLLAREGHRVLLVDWDLEAPGLQEYFKSPKQSHLSPESDLKQGVVDLLLEPDRKNGVRWKDCLIKAEFPGGELDILSAGRGDEQYQEKLRKLDWGVLFETHHVGDFLEELRSDLKNTYDFVLVDSRTGITDIGDICTVLLPDTLITIFTSNNQNIEGCKAIVERAREARRNLPVNRNKLIVVPLASRDESDSEYEEATSWRKRFSARFEKYLTEWLPESVIPEEFFNRFYIPYVPIWSFGERIPVLESPRELHDPKTIGASYVAISRLIENGLEWFSASNIGEIDDLKSKQAEIRVVEDNYSKVLEEQARLQAEITQLLERLEASNRDKAFLADENAKLEEIQYEARHELKAGLLEVSRSSSRRVMLGIGLLAAVLSAAGYFGYNLVIQNASNSNLLAEQLAAQNAKLEAQLEDLQAESNMLQTRLLDVLEQIQSQQGQ